MKVHMQTLMKMLKMCISCVTVTEAIYWVIFTILLEICMFLCHSVTHHTRTECRMFGCHWLCHRASNERHSDGAKEVVHNTSCTSHGWMSNVPFKIVNVASKTGVGRPHHCQLLSTHHQLTGKMWLVWCKKHYQIGQKTNKIHGPNATQ